VTPLASDGRIAIRRFLPTDLAAFYAAIDESRAHLAAWLPWMHDGYAIADTDSGTDFAVLVEDAASGEVLGAAGLHDVDRAHRFAQLGYWVRASRRGRGIAPAAARLAARWAFDEAGLGRVEIVVALGNAPSRRAAERSGARYEGCARNRLLIRGESHDAAVYAFVPGDFA